MFSLSKKFIFFHSGRCGGTSIKHFLEDQIEDCIRCGHESVASMESMISDYNIDCSNFFRFTSVRNPWQRMVSNYLHTERYNNLSHRHLLNKIDHFRINLKYILEYRSMPDKLHNNLFPKYDDFDLVLKIEDIDIGIEKLSKHLDIEPKSIGIKNSIDRDFPYEIFYDKYSIELIEKYFYKSIEKFNYSF